MAAQNTMLWAAVAVMIENIGYGEPFILFHKVNTLSASFPNRRISCFEAFVLGFLTGHQEMCTCFTGVLH